MVNRRGWLRIVEASIAVIIIISLLLLISEKKEIANPLGTEEIINPFLEEIALNISLRKNILSYDTSKDIYAPSNKAILDEVRAYLDKKMSDNIEFDVAICNIDVLCFIEPFPNGEVYAKERVISDVIGGTQLNPRKIKIFIWKKD